MKTVKEIALEIGVSPQTIRNTIRELGLDSVLPLYGKGCAVGFAVDERAENLIKSRLEEGFTAKSTAKRTAKNCAVDFAVDFAVDIQKELDEKNRQIERLQEENKRLISALEAVTENLKGAQLLHAKTLSARLEDKNDTNIPEDNKNASEAKTGTLARLFRRKRAET